MDLTALGKLIDLGGTVGLAAYAIYVAMDRNKAALKSSEEAADRLEMIIDRLINTLNDHAAKFSELSTTIRGCPYYAPSERPKDRE